MLGWAVLGPECAAWGASAAALRQICEHVRRSGNRGGPARRGLRRTTSKAGVVMVEDISASVHAIILAGGPADNPLARYRAMPSVELGAEPT